MIETIITESMILELLPFMEVTGTSVTYNREATLPAATFYDVGDAWTEATPTFTQKTATLKILGGDADVDNFLQATYADPNDIEAEVTAWTGRRTAAGSSSTSAGGSSRRVFSASVRSRRTRSMARLRAVVMIQPAGLGGRPLTGHRCAAAANASCTASSAARSSRSTENA